MIAKRNGFEPRGRDEVAMCFLYQTPWPSIESAAMVDLRPLTLGEILDRSASFWRANWRALFKLFLGFQLAQWVVLKGAELVIRSYFPLARGGAATIEALKVEPTEALRQLLWAGGTVGGVMLIYLFVFNFAGMAASHFIWPRMLGRTSTIADAMRRAMTRMGTMVGFFALMLGWSLLVTVFLQIPAALGFVAAVAVGEGVASVAFVALAALLSGFGMLLAILWFALRFLLGPQVLALEELGAWAVFKRCDALASGRITEGFLGLVKVRLAVLVTVMSVIIFSVSLVFGLPALVLQAIYGNIFDPQNATPDAVPQLILVPAQLLQVVAQAGIAPLYSVFAVVFYLDMRVRREGLDLELKMNEAQG